VAALGSCAMADDVATQRPTAVTAANTHLDIPFPPTLPDRLVLVPHAYIHMNITKDKCKIASLDWRLQ
jgi:hypothetical protein